MNSKQKYKEGIFTLRFPNATINENHLGISNFLNFYFQLIYTQDKDKTLPGSITKVYFENSINKMISLKEISFQLKISDKYKAFGNDGVHPDFSIT